MSRLDEEPSVTRRSVLAAGATVAGFAATTGSVRAASTDLADVDEEFSHVDTTYESDIEALEQFQPRLVMQSDDRTKFKHQLAYVARSEKYDTYACCYIARYSAQDGVGNADSHLGDTEPIYVFVNEDTDSPTEVVFSAWHWNAAGAMKADANLSADRVSTATHVSLDVANPHHHYSLREDDRGVFYELADWHEYRQSLVDNGLYHRGSAAAFEEPWVLSADHNNRAGWWSEDGVVFSGIPPDIHVDYALMRVWDLLGVRGAGSRQQDLR